MAITSILVPMAGVARDAQSLALARHAAGAGRAHLRALFPRPDARSLLASVSGLDADALAVRRLLDDAEQDATRAGQRARESFSQWSTLNAVRETDTPRGGQGLTADWCEVVGPADQVIARAGGTVDLIVHAAPDGGTGSLDQTTIEAALFTTGRPVLLVPAQLPADLFESAIVAWNGSPEANRAVTAALPLLARCRRVSVFCEPESKRPAADVDALIGYLAWHDIVAARVPGGSYGGIVEQLRDASERMRASLLVSGAYTHGRLRHLVFGGVTSHLIDHANVPTLLAH